MKQLDQQTFLLVKMINVPEKLILFNSKVRDTKSNQC